MGILFAVTLFFGIIHGLGFSSFFVGSVGSGTDKLVWLLEFALGIEAAQAIIVICVLIFALIFQSLFNYSKRDWVLVVASIVIGLVIPMLIKNNIW